MPAHTATLKDRRFTKRPMQPLDRSATRIIANRSSSSTPRLGRQPTIRDTAEPGRARTRRNSAAAASREPEAPMSLERDDTGEFSIPPTQYQQQGTADTRVRASPRAAATSANSPGVSEATSHEISRGTSSAHTTRAADTYGGNPKRRARARWANSSEIPLPQKGTPNSSGGAEPNSGKLRFILRKSG
jgi:hypothetical protein